MLIGSWLLDLIVETLNLRHASPALPREFEGYFDAQKYRTAQDYLRDNTRFSLIRETFFTALVVVFILAGGFNAVDRWARGFGFGPIVTGLIFAGILLLGSQLLRLPFSVYHTFVTEQKYGFNRTTPGTFALDMLKGLVLTALLGGAVFAGIVWFFGETGGLAWVYSWIAVVVFQLFVQFIAPVVILPLFNKFVPVEEGELRQRLEDYARAQDFRMRGLYKMDSSRRTTKSNAFFTGFGKYRRIVLFDNLIERHTVDELVSVLAHEMGHYKRKHIIKGLLLSLATTGLMFFILSLFINSRGLFEAFGMEEMSVYAGIVFFGFLFTPISLLLGIAGNILSRKYEYESDAYAVTTFRKPGAMIAALKKLSVDNLSNLTPHPLKVFLEYGHPPVLKRIEAIRRLEKITA